MVAIPMFVDQMHNAERIVAAGIGLRVDPDRVPDDLTSTIQRVLDDPTYRANALCVADEIATRPTPGQAVQRIRTMVAGSTSPTITAELNDQSPVRSTRC